MQSSNQAQLIPFPLQLSTIELGSMDENTTLIAENHDKEKSPAPPTTLVTERPTCPLC